MLRSYSAAVIADGDFKISVVLNLLEDEVTEKWNDEVVVRTNEQEWGFEV